MNVLDGVLGNDSRTAKFARYFGISHRRRGSRMSKTVVHVDNMPAIDSNLFLLMKDIKILVWALRTEKRRVLRTVDSINSCLNNFVTIGGYRGPYSEVGKMLINESPDTCPRVSGLVSRSSCVRNSNGVKTGGAAEYHENRVAFMEYYSECGIALVKELEVPMHLPPMFYSQKTNST